MGGDLLGGVGGIGRDLVGVTSWRGLLLRSTFSLLRERGIFVCECFP